MTLTRLVSAAVSLTFQTSFFDIVVIGVTAAIVYHVLVIAYRLTLHPLARYPGRTIDKISIWPMIFQCYSGDRHLRLLEAHKKYGSVVRIGPNHLDFDTVTAQTAIHRDRNTNVRKSDWYKLEPAFSGDFSVQTVIDKKEHDFRRRVLQPAFSDNALREQERFIDENVGVLLKKLGTDVDAKGWTTPRDISVWATYWGFDFISDLAFGSRFNLLDDTTHRYLPDLLKNSSQFLYYVGRLMKSKTSKSIPPPPAAYLPLQPLWRVVVGSPFLTKYFASEGAREGQKYFAASETKLEERKAAEQSGEKSQRKDIFHYLFQSRDPDTGLGFSHAQLMADSGLLIAAGADGVAVTVAAAVFYLMRYPECTDKLLQELKESFSTLDEIRGTKLDWSLMRAARLEYDNPKKPDVKTEVKTLGSDGAGMGMADSVNVLSAAKFLVKIATEGLYVREAVVIKN